MAAATALQVDVFLNRLKGIGASNIDLARQTKTLDYLRLKELAKDEVIALLQNLARADYSRGPMQNDWGTGDVWEFGLMVGEDLIYVKLSMTSVRRDHSAICMSFHPAEQPMKFPFDRR